MHWLKHDAGAHMNVKHQKLIRKYGIQGYGLYWMIVEMITERIDENNLTFTLEQDLEMLVRAAHLDKQVGVQIPFDPCAWCVQFLNYCTEIKLFYLNCDDEICCPAIAERLTKSMTSNHIMRKIIETLKSYPTPEQRRDAIMNKTIDIDTEKEMSVQVNGSLERFAEFWALYPRKINKKRAEKIWVKQNLDLIADLILARLQSQLESDPAFGGDTKFIPHPSTYLNNERWNDDFDAVEAADDWAEGAV